MSAGATSVRVYFPPTKWYDWYTHRVASASGGEAQELDTPLDHMQVPDTRKGRIIISDWGLTM